MALGWKVLIPVTLVWIAVTAVSIVVDFGQIRRWLFVAAGALLVLLIAGSLVGAASDRRRPVTGGTS
jgi:hypothetical protein